MTLRLIRNLLESDIIDSIQIPPGVLATQKDLTLVAKLLLYSNDTEVL